MPGGEIIVDSGPKSSRGAGDRWAGRYGLAHRRTKGDRLFALGSATGRVDDDGEVILDGKIEQFVGNFQRPPLEQAIVSQLQQQIAGLATA